MSLLATGAGRVGASVIGAANAASAVTLLAPASNPKGLIIRTISQPPQGSSNNIVLYVGTSAPSGTNDITKARINYSNSVSGAAAAFSTDKCPLPIMVPAGQGIYSFATAAAGETVITYDALP